MSNPYQDFLAYKELSDRAMKRREYRKAVDHYQEAISLYHSPGPKYNAAVQALAEARLHLGAASKAPGKQLPALVENGVFKPSSVWVRLFTNEQMEQAEWNTLANRVFQSYVDADDRLRSIMFSAPDVLVQKSWEFVPHDGSGFFQMAMRAAANWMEAHRQTEQTRWVTTFAKEGVLPAGAGSPPAQLAIFIVIFGSEELSSTAQAPSKDTDKLSPAPDRKKWWQFSK